MCRTAIERLWDLGFRRLGLGCGLGLQDGTWTRFTRRFFFIFFIIYIYRFFFHTFWMIYNYIMIDNLIFYVPNIKIIFYSKPKS